MTVDNHLPSRDLVPRLVTLMLVLASAAVFLAGCAGTHRVGGSPLSAAVQEAGKHSRDRDERDRDEGKRRDRDDEDKRRDRDDKDKRRVLHAGREVWEPAVVVVESDSRRHRHDRRGDEDSSGPVNISLGLVAGRSGFEGRELERARLVALEVRGTPPDTHPRLELGLALAGAFMDVEPGLDRSLRGVAELSLGLSARYYAAPRPRPAGVYGVAGFEVGALWWDYASPILIEDHGTVYEVDGDWMGTYSPYVGVGISLSGANGMRVGASLIGGYKFFDRHTHEGLYNDLFDPAPFARVQLDLGHALR